MLKHGFKSLLRSRSRQFTRDLLAVEAGAIDQDGRGSVPWWNGDGCPVHYRRGTSDVSLVYGILFKPGRKSEYWLPAGLEPAVVFDIGANIGVTARYLAQRFPQAAVHGFEPIPANVELARDNAAAVPGRISIHPFGLGASAGSFTFSIPTGHGVNRGGYSRFGAAGAGADEIRAEIRATSEVLAALGGLQPDVIKIDTEGAEYDILGSFPREVLSRVSWIYGELHTEAIDAPSAFRVLDLLFPWFDIEVHKPLRKRNWFFDACNRSISDKFRGFRRT